MLKIVSKKEQNNYTGTAVRLDYTQLNPTIGSVKEKITVKLEF